MIDENAPEEVSEEKDDDLTEIRRFINSTVDRLWGDDRDDDLRLACFTLGWSEDLIRYMLHKDGGPTGGSTLLPEWYARESRRKKPTLLVQRMLLELRDAVMVVSTEMQIELTNKWLTSGNPKSPAGQILAARDRVRWATDGRTGQVQGGKSDVPMLQIGDAG